MAVSGGEKRGPEPAPNTLKSSPSPDPTPEPSSPEHSEDHANPEATTPEQEAREESEESLRGLLKAYRETLKTVEDLPVVVWVPWGGKGVGRYLKVPYLRLFLEYFVAYHIDRSLNALNRELLATAAISSDPDANSSKREAVKLYSGPDLLCGARGACDSDSSAGVRKRILRARPGRGDVEVRRGLLEHSIGRR
jgi:hypothetical protein